ncbi:MAG: thiolase family protein [Bdellovibrionales bacterium]|nr:thiolase family protein [Bdellovibrionales bacterium]
MSSAFIVSARRTPVGTFQGAFSSVPAPRLGATAIQAALQSAGVNAADINECIMGEVLTAGVGQAPARQAAIYAGLPNSVPCMTINKVCGSGLKSVMLAADNILLGHTDLAVAGGQENMTLAPHLLENSRAGYRMGHINAADSMIKDGLWDPYSNFHMGSAAELCVKEYKIARQAQDEFAIESYKRAQAAQKSGLFSDEITPVTMTVKGTSQSFDSDEEPGKARFDKMLELRAAFEKDGTITAANASKINDGAAALVLASDRAVKDKGLKPIARVVSHGTFAHDPKWFTTAPVTAIKRALERAKLQVGDIDLFEINEAFAMVPMVAMKELGIAHDKVNVNGGAVAIGHPIGASGARILTTLIHALGQKKKKYGLATLCVGGGEGVALIVERL